MTEPCKDCAVKDTELGTVTGQLGQVTKQLEESIENAGNLQAKLDKPAELPSMTDFLQHCETCGDHGKHLED